MKDHKEVLKQKCIEIRDEVMEFLEKQFPNSKQIERELHFLAMANFMLGGQYKVMKEVWGVDKEQIGEMK